VLSAPKKFGQPIKLLLFVGVVHAEGFGIEMASFARHFHESLGTPFRDLQQPNRCSGRRTKATLPGDGGGFGHVEEIGEDGLADVELLSDRGDFVCRHGRGACLESMGSCRDLAFGVIDALLHAGDQIVETEIRDGSFCGHIRI
jgi:hypothetical protein